MSESLEPRVRLLATLAPRPWAKARPALAALNANAPLRAGLLATAACYAVLQVLFCVHVHLNFEGNYAGPFLITKAFGVPADEAANGVQAIEPVPGQPYIGWDAQFYYHVSNDPWMARDAKDHIDNPSYRYQRVGLPLLARGVSELLGCRVTSPFAYNAVQLLMTAVGFGGLVFWLTANGLPWYYALAWLLSAGTFLTVRYGMPDPACDGFMILAFLGAYYRRLALYVPAATMMCLGRETYVVFPFCLWVGTLLNRIEWPGVRNYWVRLAVVAVPGAVVVGWAAFVSHRLHLPLLHGARSIPWGGLTDYPFVAGWDAVKIAWRSGGNEESYRVLAAFGTLVAVLLFGLRYAGKSRPVLCLLPFIVLLTMAGSIVWSTYNMGSAKNVLPAVAFGLFLLPWSRGLLLRAVLLLQIAVGVNVIYTEGIVRQPQFSAEQAAVSTHGSAFQGVPTVPGPRVSDYRMTISATVASAQDDPPYHGPWRWCHREGIKVRVTAVNTSAQSWPREPISGDHSLQIGFILRDAAGGEVFSTTCAMPKDVPPGESFEQVYPLPYLRLNGAYTLQVSIIQQRDDWFFRHDPNSQFSLPVEFR